MDSLVRKIVPYIYHERQQEGSMLCAQHALNSLLQQDCFSPADLSAIGHDLDSREQQFDEGSRGGRSTNMDDTGFFSIQVIEQALQVWGLTLLRWRSEDMKPYQDHPETQLAFILNYEQHWYTLRRFGPECPDPANPNSSVWFNLNSFLARPEPVGSTHLGMVLHQAELERYSVFVVVPLNSDDSCPLARTKADQIASGEVGSDVGHAMGFEDEDMDIQAALQASLMMDTDTSGGDSHATGSHESYPGPISANPFANPFGTVDVNSASGSRTPTRRTTQQDPIPPPVRQRSHPVPYPVQDDEDDEDDEDYVDASDVFPSRSISSARPHPEEEDPNMDPVEASRRRGEAIMAQMMRQQEAALRFTAAEEEARIRAGLQEPRRSRRDEDDEVARAIAASLAEARERGEDVDVEEPEEMDFIPARTAVPGIQETHRVYDDDDAELQAALKASLEGLPEGFRIPDTPPRPSKPPTPPALVPAALPPIAGPSKSASTDEGDETETESEADVSVVEEAPAPDVDEMRKRRLARFGG
ncbi:Josephin-domain-containing protein [Cristinia sonorae]|uniref:ubiquitinyl hydrolase 1 n=1 Tax=Cristinia sonorae TaxID=1940300 RepID=A0A8K0XUI0_9AGAR|nr:Josephin-domain-containing protein [Cristinia sonorae]